MSDLGELGEGAPLDSGGVVQLEGTVGLQLRKAAASSAETSWPCNPEDGEATDEVGLPLEVMGVSVVLSPCLVVLICVGASGCLFLKSLSTSSVCRSSHVMTTLRKVSDFVYFLPFLFSLYHHPEHSGTLYGSPRTPDMTYTLDHSSMT